MNSQSIVYANESFVLVPYFSNLPSSPFYASLLSNKFHCSLPTTLTNVENLTLSSGTPIKQGSLTFTLPTHSGTLITGDDLPVRVYQYEMNGPFSSYNTVNVPSINESSSNLLDVGGKFQMAGDSNWYSINGYDGTKTIQIQWLDTGGLNGGVRTPFFSFTQKISGIYKIVFTLTFKNISV